MAHLELKKRAVDLRSRGYSLNEISRKLGVSKGISSRWCRDVVLSKKALNRLNKLSIRGRAKSQLVVRKRIREENKIILDNCYKTLGSQNFSKETLRIFCALLYGCEGTKKVTAGIAFVNSDPNLIKFFLCCLRRSFNLDENKLRVCVHLHSYHDKDKQIDFWSKVTKIDKRLFIKPYQKKNTGKRLNDNYQGCVCVDYYDAKVGRELKKLNQLLMNKYGRVR